LGKLLAFILKKRKTTEQGGFIYRSELFWNVNNYFPIHKAVITVCAVFMNISFIFYEIAVEEVRRLGSLKLNVKQKNLLIHIRRFDRI